MKRFSEQLNKKALTVKLRAAEKRELRERVVSYMEYHPLPADLKSKTKKGAAEETLLTEAYTTVAVPFKLIAKWAFSAAAIVLVILPFAAERSVPGDNLYAIKQFNEEVRGTLAFNTVQKVEWETERLNRRIAEARLLASEGRLTDEVEAEVAAAVRTHSDNAQKNIAVLRGEDADEATLASMALETTLTVQSAALQDESNAEGELDSDTTTPNTPSILATAVEETRVQANANNASSTIPAFDKVMAKVEINTTRVYELRDSLVDVASTEQIANITRRIEDIERSVAEAIALRESDDAKARTILVDSLQRTQKLVVFMTNLEVSEMGDIESIVPVVLTTEEEQAIVSNLETELQDLIGAIDEALLTTEDTELTEKATTILSEIDVLITNIGTSSDFVSTKSVLTAAVDLANNIAVLLELKQDATSETTTSEPVEETVATTTDPVATSTDETLDAPADESEDAEAEAEPATETSETASETPTDQGTSTRATTSVSTDSIDRG